MRLQIADLDAQRQKSLPTRVIWDLPVRRRPPQEQEAQDVNAGKPEPSEALQPSTSAAAPAMPAASASAHTDNHATQPLAAPAPPSSQTLGATSPAAPTTPAPGAGVPAATPGPPKPIPGSTLTTEGDTADGYFSLAKPALKRYRYSRWY
jgi:hypothetical protein